MTEGSALSRLAKQQPADPPPTMMKSYVLSSAIRDGYPLMVPYRRGLEPSLAFVLCQDLAHRYRFGDIDEGAPSARDNPKPYR